MGVTIGALVEGLTLATTSSSNSGTLRFFPRPFPFVLGAIGAAMAQLDAERVLLRVFTAGSKSGSWSAAVSLSRSLCCMLSKPPAWLERSSSNPAPVTSTLSSSSLPSLALACDEDAAAVTVLAAPCVPTSALAAAATEVLAWWPCKTT